MMIKKLKSRLKQIASDNSGLALIEFAYSLPIFLGLGMYGSEVAYLTLQKTSLSQTTVSVSDNAARMGTTVNDDISKTIFESDIIQLIAGAAIQAGDIDLMENGRIIISSLEVNEDGDQVIAWQRCRGKLDVDSEYGDEGTNGTDDVSFVGMGATGSELQAVEGDAIMYVEISYQYQPLFGDMFMEPTILYEEAAYNIRDSRDLDAGLRNDGVDEAYTCDLLEGID